MPQKRKTSKLLVANIDDSIKSNNDIVNLLSSTQIATIFLDDNLNVSLFTAAVSSIFQLQGSDLGRPVSAIINKLIYPGLINDFNDVLRNEQPKEVEVKTIDDRTLWMKITPYETPEKLYKGLVITFTDVTESKRQEAELIKYKNHLEELVEERTKELLQSYHTAAEEKRKAQQYLDIAGTMIIAIDNSGDVVLANKKASEILGYEQDEILGKNWLEHFIPEKEKVNIEAALMKLSSTHFEEEKYRENLVKTKTGENRMIAWHNEQVLDKQGNIIGFISSGQDITEMQRTLSALRESEEKFKNIFDYSNTGIAIGDINGNVVDANSEYVKIVGYPKSQLLKMKFFDFSHKEDLKKEKKLREKVLKGISDSYRIEKRYINAKNEITWVDLTVTVKRDENGSINLFIGMVLDITNRKRAEKELQDKNEFIQTILNNLPIGVATNDIDTGKASYLNSKFEEIYGWPKYNLTDVERFFKCVQPKDDHGNEMKHQIIKDIQSGNPGKMHWENLTIKQKSGKIRKVNAVNIPLFQQNTMISTVIDITDLKKTEEELIEAKNIADQANALKSAFLENTSHEIRTPLNGIIGFTELLERWVPKNSKTKTYIDIIKNSGDQLLKIIDDIIDLSKIDSNQLVLRNEIFDFNQLIDDIFYFHKHSKLNTDNPNVEFKQKKGAKGLLVQSDQSRIKQILDNLITNALKQTDSGYVEFGYSLNSEGHITLFVKDTGHGIEEDKIEQIFDRFVKLRSKSGTGLGLSIVKGLVNLLNGEIRVESKVGVGTTFEVSFLIQVKNSKTREKMGESKGEKDSVKWSEKTILVVEDDINSFYLIEAILKDTNVNLVHVSSGDQIIDSYKNYKPDLILMDINMPVVNGFEATEMIRKVDQKTPIIAQTAYAMEDEKLKCLEVGCDAYISKPIDRKKFVALITEALQ